MNFVTINCAQFLKKLSNFLNIQSFFIVVIHRCTQLRAPIFADRFFYIHNVALIKFLLALILGLSQYLEVLSKLSNFVPQFPDKCNLFYYPTQ